MPRDATDTRTRLLEAAEHLFARRGLHAATTRAITDAAGQRNTSALTYHFGSRAGVLRAILVRHGEPLDEQRATHLDGPVDVLPTRDLVAALVLPYATCLETPGGRSYLRIVAQLTSSFPDWRVEDDLPQTQLRRILGALEHRVPADAVTATERVVAMIQLLTVAMAERARRLDEDDAGDGDTGRFLAMLADLMVAGLEAPLGPPLEVPLGTEGRRPMGGRAR